MRIAALFSLILVALPLSAMAKSPVLVELYTAQGCRSCRDADVLLGKLAERPGVLALTFSVDYWDYLGWTDTFARPEYAARQRAYVTRLKLREPYTPQIVVDGREETQGQKTSEVDRLIRVATAQARNAPDMRFVGKRRVDVGSGRVGKGGAEVWIVRYDPRVVEVTVKAGDNRGETVVLKNVVRQMQRVGVWRGSPRAFRLPAPGDEALKTAVIVQAPRGGRVLALAVAAS